MAQPLSPLRPPVLTGQAPPSFFSTAEELQDLPPTTREELLLITNQSTLESHLEKLQDLTEFRSGYNETDLYPYPSSSGFYKIITYPNQDIAIYYYLSPILVSPNNDQTYALLMLKFANSTSSDELITTDAIDYNVKIDGTNNNFTFDENGTTTTGLDIKILNTTYFEDVFMEDKDVTISIAALDGISINEQTRSILLLGEEASFAAEASQFSIADALRDLPQNSSLQLQGITNQSNLASHLEVLGQLINFPLDFPKVTMYYGGNITIIYYYFSPVHLDSNGEPYALLMLKFTDPRSYFTLPRLDYNVRINGTNNNFNFEENGTTDTGIDVKIIRGRPFAEILDSDGKYSAVVDILNINNSPIYEETKPFTVNFTR